jgi:ArsR family transcriptional regulator
MSEKTFVKITGHLLKNISQPARIRILQAIGEGEACVCHLEALLGYRQAYISQHIMALRKIGLLDSRREGRFIYYRLRNPRLLDLFDLAAEIAGVPQEALAELRLPRSPDSCPCPNCSPIPAGA